MATVKKVDNKIQLPTRRNILDSFSISRLPWYGQLEQPSFLGRLYDLNAIKSFDDRYKTAWEDIQKHTVLNYDWPDEWIFTDTRFNLLHATDTAFLEFLCMTLHPTVRQNSEEVTTLLEIYNNNLKRDGFVIEKSGEIVGKPLFAGIELNGLASSSTTTTTTTIKPEIRKALVVGCSSYQHGTTLLNPINDANGMESILQTLGFEVIKKIDPSRRELKMIIDEFGDKLRGSDVGLFYFAGHGVQVKGLNYLIPIDADLKTERMVEYDCVEAGRILGHMEDARTNVNIIILDACRDNPFERSWGRGIGQRGLASMNAPIGSLIAYATAPGSTASDGTGNNGLYTGSLLDYISEEGTPILSMFEKVRRKVLQDSNAAQTPWESTSLTGPFYFKK